MKAFDDFFGGCFLDRLPSNGGKLLEDKKQFTFLNTCSIDYFILVCYIISRKFEYCLHEKEKKTPFDHLLIEFGKSIGSKNNWDEARLSWLNFNNNNIKKSQTNENKFLYNCLTDEFTAYYSSYSFYQQFRWFNSCPNSNCLNNKNPLCYSNAFILK